MEDFWAVFWIAVVLKIPVAMLLYIVWWAVKDPPMPVVEDTDGGGSDRDPGRASARTRPAPAATRPARRARSGASGAGAHGPRIRRVPAGHRERAQRERG